MINKDKIEEIMKTLKQQRDELRVQIHLAKAEAKDLWGELEDKWDEFEPKAKQAGEATADASKEVFKAVKLLGAEIKEGYEKIRKSI